MTRQPGPRSLLLGLLLLSPVLAQPGHSATAAPATRLFLHSATGSYAEDARGNRPYTAPAGSVLSVDPPARATSATAGGGGGTPFLPGGPTTPTWANPVSGVVTTVCVDLFVEATSLASTAPAGTEQKIHVRNTVGGATGTTFVHALSSDNHPAGIVRITKLVPAPEPYELDGAALFTLTGLGAGTAAVQRGNPDWRVYYDSLTHFSSVTFNATPKTCTPAKLKAPNKA
jgi:hypothetical protein